MEISEYVENCIMEALFIVRFDSVRASVLGGGMGSWVGGGGGGLGRGGGARWTTFGKQLVDGRVRLAPRGVKMTPRWSRGPGSEGRKEKVRREKEQGTRERKLETDGEGQGRLGGGGGGGVWIK